MKTRVYVVDDDRDVREALTVLLRTAGMEVEAFPDATKLLAVVKERTPGCIIADLRMPLVTGLQLQDKLREMKCLWPVVVITGHGDINACRRAFKGGAIEFLTKPVDEHELIEAVQKGLTQFAGRAERDAEIAEAQELLAKLTPRERDVLDMVARGWATKQIATALDLSARTVDVHRAHIAEKLGTTSVAELARLSILTNADNACTSVEPSNR